MNTIINTNINALTTHRSMVSAGLSHQRNAERLSSGMHINRAADDAAGLGISQKMQAQIRGLKKAVVNNVKTTAMPTSLYPYRLLLFIFSST